VERYGMGVAVGDYDNDGRPDLYLTALKGNRLYQNQGNGRFRDVTRRAGVGGRDLSTSPAWLDYDGDGRLDLFVCRYMDYDLATNPRCRDHRQRLAYCSPNVYQGTHSLLYRNNGDGTFTDVTRKSRIQRSVGRSLGVACADFDRNGMIDLFVSNDLSPNFLFLNNGDGTFREEAGMAGVSHGDDGVARAGMGVDCADYKNDGRMGAAVMNFEKEPISLFANNGDGTFTNESYPSGIGTPSLPYLKWGCQFVDLDLDGWQDLFVTAGHVDDHADESPQSLGYAQPCEVLHNRGGRFSDISRECGPFFSRRQVARGAAFGDYDNDGDTDALIACNDQPVILLRNDSPRSGGWIRVSLQGRGCNRDALGARVRVTAGGTTQMRFHRSGTSYLADHDRRLLFGIGQSPDATVEVRWPCGATQSLRVRAGETMTIQEKGCRVHSRTARR
jgi:enediyne biosynthesis protein E4